MAMKGMMMAVEKIFICFLLEKLIKLGLHEMKIMSIEEYKSLLWGVGRDA